MAAKTSRRHPYAAIEHRVIDSDAYADLTFSAQALLVLLARQLSKTNNGHLQATFAYCNKRGFGSEHTLRLAIAELIEHGFIYRTRSHGANGAWARYAVTWLSIKRKENLFLAGFQSCAWLSWRPMTNGKSTRQKLLESSGRKCSFTPELPAETAGKVAAETADYELMPIGVIKAWGANVNPAIQFHPQYQHAQAKQNWLTDEAARLKDAGLSGHLCFQLPSGRTLQ